MPSLLFQDELPTLQSAGQQAVMTGIGNYKEKKHVEFFNRQDVEQAAFCQAHPELFDQRRYAARLRIREVQL